MAQSTDTNVDSEENIASKTDKSVSGAKHAKDTGAKKKKKERREKSAPYLQNRELSWLTFDQRVLDQGHDSSVPLLEQITFVSIFSSNLQEFFMVRVGSLTDLSLVDKGIVDKKSGWTPAEQLSNIYDRCHELYPEAEAVYNDIQKRMRAEGIYQLTVDELNDDQRDYLHDYLEVNVVPFLSPQVVNSRHPFPHLENGALYVLVSLSDPEQASVPNPDEGKKKKKKGKNVGAEGTSLGLIPLPHRAERVIKLPGEGTQFILLESAMKLIIDDIFVMYETNESNVICVTRNADLDATEGSDEVEDDYREHMKRILKKRARLAPVRLEAERELSKSSEKFLLKQLGLQKNQMFISTVPMDMSYAWGLPGLVDDDTAERLTNPSFTPTWPACVDQNRSMIEQVCEKDVLLSYPYESMDPFVKLLREASTDPSVISIKITLYRLASQSHLAEALIAAAENGKEVTALFELRARFDESNNIEWSQRFEEAGATVIYGFHDYKVHSKICTIVRHTDKGIQHITQLGTGNYNEKTSKLYTDFSYITTDDRFGRDAAEFFRNMGLENLSDNYETIRVAPLQIKQMIIAKIDEQIARAGEGLPSGLFFKTNSITDKDIIDKITEASQAGVKTTMLVRGISCLVPGVEGYTENVRVFSIVGRLLEHSRIYAFGPEKDCEFYLSSADLMTRNMEKRVEIAWPLQGEEQKQQLIGYIKTCLSDTAKLRELKSDATFTPLCFFAGDTEPFSSQNHLIESARTAYTESVEKRAESMNTRAAAAHAQKIKDATLMPNTGQETPSAPEPHIPATVAETETPAAQEPVAQPVAEPAPTSSAPEQAQPVVTAPTQPATLSDQAPIPPGTIQLVEKKKKGFFARLISLFKGE